MPDFRAACAYAMSQGWLIVEDDKVTLIAVLRRRQTMGCPFASSFVFMTTSSMSNMTIAPAPWGARQVGM
jgi:hypothetical protein